MGVNNFTWEQLNNIVLLDEAKQFFCSDCMGRVNLIINLNPLPDQILSIEENSIYFRVDDNFDGILGTT